MSRSLTNPNLGDLAVLQCVATTPPSWAFSNVNVDALGALTVTASQTALLSGMGSSTGNIPQVPIPLSCMNLNLVSPMQSDGVNVSIAAATESAAGSMSATDKTRLDSLATVAISGAYTDLSGRPTLGTSSTQNTSAFATAAQGTLAASALQPGEFTTLAGYGIIDGVSVNGSYANPGWLTSFAYSKLTGAPTIPAAQINSDWNASSGLAQILNKPTLTRSFNNAQSRTVVTNQTANGTQISSTRDCAIRGIVSIQSTTTIGGPSSGTIVLEVCATNSATGTDWATVDELVSTSTATLAIVLNLVQLLAKGIGGIVPAGWYHRYRAVTATGTITYSTTATCQEVLL